MVRAVNTPDPRVMAAFDAMIAGVPGIVRKGAAMPYTSINGNMYSMISKANVIGLRLGTEDLAVFTDAHGPSPFEGTQGFINKDYVAVPPSMLGEVSALQSWFRKSHAHASGLKPKKTTR